MKKEDGLRYLPAVISLSAGLIISIVMLVNKKDSLTSLSAVFGFLLGFYLIGLLFRAVLRISATREEPQEEPQEELDNVDIDGTAEPKEET